MMVRACMHGTCGSPGISLCRASQQQHGEWQNQPKLICPPKSTYLNETQIHPIINWVKWVLTQLTLIFIGF